MKKTCTPLVMSLRPLWVRKMLKGEKTMALRRVFPFRCYSGLFATFDEAKRFVKPIYFVKTGTTRGGFVPMVRVYAEIFNIWHGDLWRFFYDSGQPYDGEFKYTYWHKGDMLYRSGLTWAQALQYQGNRGEVHLILLENIRKVNFPVTKLGLKHSPQSYAWAKKIPEERRAQ